MRAVKFSLMMLFVLSIFQISSCSKKMSNFKQETEEYLNSFAQFHNEVLSYVGNQCDPSITLRYQRFEIAKNFLNSNHDWNHIRQMTDLAYSICGSGKVSDLLGYARGGNSFSEEGIAILNQLDAIFDQVLLNAENNIDTNPEEFNMQVDQLIEYVYNNCEVCYDENKNQANEFGFILTGLYLSKSTYEFWYNAAHDPSSPWYNYLNEGASGGSQGRFLAGLWRAIKIAAADVWGFFAGGSGTISAGSGGCAAGWTADLIDAINSASEASSSV